MSGKLFGPERKPWETPADARLMPSSYTATALFSIAELAVETLGDPRDGAAVASRAKMLARILVSVQAELGEGGWNSALNMRLRGALRTAITLNPHPLQDEAAWEQMLTTTTLNIAKTAAWLHTLDATALGVQA